MSRKMLIKPFRSIESAATATHNWRRRQILRAGASTLVLGLVAPRLAWASSVLGVRVWPARDYTRVTIESDQRDDGTRRTTRYDIDLTKCIFCGFCEEACPVDAIVETHILEYHGEKRGDLYFTKDMLLAVGDRFEPEIAANKAADAKYR